MKSTIQYLEERRRGRTQLTEKRMKKACEGKVPYTRRRAFNNSYSDRVHIKQKSN